MRVAPCASEDRTRDFGHSPTHHLPAFACRCRGRLPIPTVSRWSPLSPTIWVVGSRLTNKTPREICMILPSTADHVEGTKARRDVGRQYVISVRTTTQAKTHGNLRRTPQQAPTLHVSLVSSNCSQLVQLSPRLPTVLSSTKRVELWSSSNFSSRYSLAAQANTPPHHSPAKHAYHPCSLRRKAVKSTGMSYCSVSAVGDRRDLQNPISANPRRLHHPCSRRDDAGSATILAAGHGPRAAGDDDLVWTITVGRSFLGAFSGMSPDGYYVVVAVRFGVGGMIVCCKRSR